MNVHRLRLGVRLIVLGGGLATAFTASAQSLQDALVSAYLNRPQFRADHNRQRALDEDVSRAAGGWKPQISVNGQAGYGQDRLSYDYLNPPQTTKESIHPEALILQLNQPLYDFGRTAADVDRTNFVVQGGIAHSEAVEETILGEAVQSYYDLYRDQVILDLTNQTVTALEDGLKSVRARFAKQDVTVADVTQSESRLARGIAQRVTAEGNLGISRSSFIQSTGLTPGVLGAPPRLPEWLMPKTQGEALALAMHNPTVRESEAALGAAQADVDGAISALKPTLSLQLSSQYLSETSQGHFKTQYNEALLNLQVPLYSGGVDYAKVREAKTLVAQRTAEIDEARQQAVDRIKRSLEQIKASRERIDVLQQQVTSAQRALTAVQAEIRVGTREVIDELNAEQELLDARISLAQAQHDEAAATYGALSFTGRLTARALQLPVPLYDPTLYYKAESGRWFGTGIPDQNQDFRKANPGAAPH
jgi:TolC family type I secretion outer membrane protein